MPKKSSTIFLCVTRSVIKRSIPNSGTEIISIGVNQKTEFLSFGEGKINSSGKIQIFMLVQDVSKL